VSFLVLAAYGIYFFVLKTALEQIGSALAMAGGINAAIACIRFYRSGLERLRDFHLGKGIFRGCCPFPDRSSGPSVLPCASGICTVLSNWK